MIIKLLKGIEGSSWPCGYQPFGGDQGFQLVLWLSPCWREIKSSSWFCDYHPVGGIKSSSWFCDYHPVRGDQGFQLVLWLSPCWREIKSSSWFCDYHPVKGIKSSSRLCDYHPVRGISRDLSCHVIIILLNNTILINKYLLFCFVDVPSSTSSKKSFCSNYYPDTMPCPPFSDIFIFLHNYTNPRPITADQIRQVLTSCWTRLHFFLLLVGRPWVN